MTVDGEFYCQRLLEELQLADSAKTPSIRKLHNHRADEYGRWLSKRSDSGTPDVISQWKLRRRSEAFADWLADVL